MSRHMKRTTIRLPDNVMRRAKKLAADSGRTFAAVVEDALEAAISERKRPTRKKRIKLRTFKGDGLRPGVNLDRSAELRDVMDGFSAAP